MRMDIITFCGATYSFYEQQGQYFFYMNGNWVPCNIISTRARQPGQAVEITTGHPIQVLFADPRFNFVTDPVMNINMIM